MPGYARAVRRSALIGSAVLAAAALAGTAAAGGATLGIRSDPPLLPRFNAAIRDYVDRCQPGGHVRMRIDAPPGTLVSVDGLRPRGGVFSRRRRLDPGQQLELSVRRRGKTRAYHVRCLPPDFPAWTFRRSARPYAAFYVLTPSPWVAIWDDHGVPLWWMRAGIPIAQDAKPFGHRTIGWFAAPNSYLGPARYEIHRLDGSLVTTVRARSALLDSHDIQRLPGGDYLLIAYRERPQKVDMSWCGGPHDATVFDEEIQRVRPGHARPVWSWSSRGHIALSETARWCAASRYLALPDGTMAYDLVHINSVQLVGHSVIASMRHTDSVYRIDYRSGRIVWKLGGTRTPQSLRILGDRFAGSDFGGQHTARELADGTVTLHDNGIMRNRPPRAVRYRIDQRARTASLLEEVADPLASTSFCCGSAEKLADGGWLMSWGGTPVVTELAPGGSRRFSLEFARGQYSYRASPIPRGRLSRHALRAGMDAMNPRP
jgi:arylsulfotransferase ASST